MMPITVSDAQVAAEGLRTSAYMRARNYRCPDIEGEKISSFARAERDRCRFRTGKDDRPLRENSVVGGY
jgi:hypothetical protein